MIEKINDFLNIGLGVLDKENNVKIYGLSRPENIEKENLFMYEGLCTEISNPIPDIKDFELYNDKALINDDQFYIDLKKIDEKSEFSHIKSGFNFGEDLSNLISNATQIGLKKKDFVDLDNNRLKLKFIIIEKENVFLLLYLNPHNKVLKHKRGINLGNKPTKLDIQYAIIYPEYVSAFLDKKNGKLYVINSLDFERMFNLKVIRLAKAERVFEQFKLGNYTLGSSGLKVIFSSDIDLKKKEYFKVRQITYLASYNPQSKPFKTENILEAIGTLEKKYRPEINEDKNIIEIKDKWQFKTFVSILHDSIILRMLSGTYEI